MTLRKALTYNDEDGRKFFWDDYDFNDVADFIADELEADGYDLDGREACEVAEDMADGDIELPDDIGKRLSNHFARRACEWYASRNEFDEFDVLGL